MAAQTIRDVWGRVALHVPAAPISLVQSWVQDAYDELFGRRHWGWARREYLLTTLAARTATVNVTQGLTAITGAAVFVTATDPGRQIRFGGNTPIYTINTVTDVNTATLTQAYAETTGAKTATIASVYLPMPADFRSIFDVTDLSLSRPIPWWIGQDRLDLFDPARMSSDSRFRVLAAAHHSQVTSLSGRVTYEAWPHPTAVGTYLLRYFVRTDTLDDDTLLPGVLATYTRAIEKGALAEAAQWPGTPERKNPYFNLALARSLAEQFDAAVKQIDVMDDDQYLMDLQQIDLSRYGLAALAADTTLMRQSDATVADYL